MADQNWDGGWAASTAAQRKDWAAAGGDQRWSWLLDMLDFAMASGALAQDRDRRTREAQIWGEGANLPLEPPSSRPAEGALPYVNPVTG